MELLDETNEDTTDAPPIQESETRRKEQEEREKKAQKQEEEEKEEELNCSSCGQAITNSKHRTSVGGKFQHTCVNPAGILFEIGCFSKAKGCREIGPESDDFSWFDGYVWQVSICTSCKSHLGWRFWSSDNEFYGLILNRLS